MLFEDGSPLVPCVNEALATLRDDGTLDRPPAGVAAGRRRHPDAVRIVRAVARWSPESTRRSSPRSAPGLPCPRGGSRSAGHAIREEGALGVLIAVRQHGRRLRVIVVAVLRSDTWPRGPRAVLQQGRLLGVLARLSSRGFWVNMKLFAIAQVLILAFALLVAVLRSLRGPAFFPLRLLTIVYIDLFRGIPLYLVIVLLGFGVPALELPGVPSDAEFWAVVALVLSYSAYTAEVYRSGIDSVHESQRSAARALGLTQWQALRFAVLPQAVRNVIPALLNGLVSLQKDVALVSVHRHPGSGARGGDLHDHGRSTTRRTWPPPSCSSWPASRSPGSPTGTRPATVAAGCRRSHDRRVPAGSRCEGLHKSFGAKVVLDGIDLTVAEHEVVALIGPQRLRQVDPAALPRPAREGRRGHASTSTAQLVTGPRRPGERRAQADRDRVPVLQPVPAPLGARQRDAGAPPGPRRAPARRRGPGPRGAGPPRARRQGRRVPGPPVRGPAAAGRDRPGPGQRSQAAAPRRDHLGPRPRAGGRGPGRHPGPRRARA